MGELLTSIPGDIPGLLRRGSPVLVLVDSDGLAVVRGVVLDPSIEPNEDDPRCLVWNERNGRDNKAQVFVRLDLTDPTGAAMAGGWLLANATRRIRCSKLLDADRLAAIALAEHACTYQQMTPTQINTLARLVLRLAGRA